MNNMRILVVEDDMAIRNLITTTLEMQQYRYISGVNGAEGIMMTASHNPDVILLDLGLPDMDGIEVIKKIRTWSNVPIIVISARSEDTDKIEALDNGADDYLTKPFSVDELLARLRVTQRRLMAAVGEQPAQTTIYENGLLRIDFPAGIAYLQEEQIHLTPIEYKLLCILANNTGKVLTHNYLTKEIWGNSYESNTASLRVFMATIRKKLGKNPEGEQYIQTHIGIGYRMVKS